MKTLAWIGLALAVTQMGCATKEGARSEPTSNAAVAQRAAGTQRTDDGCPVYGPGTTVAAVEVEGGVALDFTTTGDVGDLRQRVRSMAERQDYGSGYGMSMDFGADPGDGYMDNHDPTDHRMRGGGMMGHGMMGHGNMMSYGSSAAGSVEDVEGGARLSFRLEDPAEVDALRGRARTWVAHMGRPECLTMGSDRRGPAQGM